jgi:hypothetical protein
MNELTFTEDRNLRDNYISHYEVLERVKNLLLIPGMEFATMKQVAEFYDVEVKAIEKVCLRNKDELISDGVELKSYKDFLIRQDVGLETVKGKVLLTLENGNVLSVPNRGLKVFPRRAILRIGMLLRDSAVAKEVRTQLLNIEEKTSNEIKTEDINEEQRLITNVGMAFASGNINDLLKATTEYNAFQNRHITKLKEDNKALVGDILEWKDRNKLNAGVRKLASVTKIYFGKMWNELYKNLQYKYGISLKRRGDKPYIQHVKQDEWKFVIMTFSAMCEAYGQSPSDMFQQVTPKKALETNY